MKPWQQPKKANRQPAKKAAGTTVPSALSPRKAKSSRANDGSADASGRPALTLQTDKENSSNGVPSPLSSPVVCGCWRSGRSGRLHTQGSMDNVTRLFNIPDRQGKLSNRIDGFNAKGEKLELCADSASDKERWVDAIESHPGVESVSMDEHPSRGERGWFG